MLNLKTGRFLINKEEPKDEQSLANVVDAQAVYDYWGQSPWEDVTRGLAQLVATASPAPERQRTPFLDFLQDTGRSITVNTPKIHYRLRGRNRTHFRVLYTTTLTTPGLRHSEFDIVLNTDVFKPSDKIAPEMAPEQQLIIQAGPFPYGDGAQYRVAYVTQNPHEFFPPEYLVENTRFHKAGASTISERSHQAGSSIFDRGHTVLEFEVGLAKTSKELEITDEALTHFFTIDTLCDDGNRINPDVPRKVTTEAEINFEAEIRWEKEQDMFWAEYTDQILDTSTNLHRHLSSGLYPFLMDGHIHRYSPYNTSIKEFTNFLDDAWYNTVTPANAMVTFYTGKPGLELADEMIKEAFGEVAVIRNPEDYIKRIGNVIPNGREAWMLKHPQFKAYELPTYGVVMFEHWPILDSEWRGGPKDPKSGKPVTAFWMIALDYGYGNGGGSNIVTVNRRNQTVWAYQAGLFGPNGGIDDRQGGRYRATHSGGYTTLYHRDSYGLFVEDINKLVLFLPNFRY